MRTKRIHPNCPGSVALTRISGRSHGDSDLHLRYVWPVDGLDTTWGHVDPGELACIVVVSPHLDDAVLGAAHLIASYPGTTVITLFAGRPPKYPSEPTYWDSCGGFAAGDDVVAIRRDEDLAAMGVLGAVPRWLEFTDHQYVPHAERSRPDQVAAALAPVIKAAAPTAVFLPMGLANPDHDVSHEAGLIVRGELVDSGVTPAWFCYEDSGYKHIPGILAWRIAKLFRSGLWPTPAVVPVRADMATKRAALEMYRSQLPPLRRDHSLDERLDANVPEQYWRLAPPPRGWEGLVDVQ